MENVGQAFFHTTKTDLKKFLKVLGCVRDLRQVTKHMFYSKLVSPKY